MYADMNDKGNPNLPASEIDLPFKDLTKLATTEQEEQLLNEYLHYSILYRYRNFLIHEARVPGNAMGIIQTDTPFYHKHIGEDKLFLAYPLKMFTDILDRAINFTETYLMNNKFDPYDFVSETTRW
jgi:hypothetical protein